MSYTLLTAGSEFNAAVLTNNFKHVRSGTMLPMAGDRMKPTTGVVDLGSPTYAWQAVVANSLFLYSTSSLVLDQSASVSFQDAFILAASAIGTLGASYERPLFGFNKNATHVFVAGTTGADTAYYTDLVVSAISGPSATQTVSVPIHKISTLMRTRIIALNCFVEVAGRFRGRSQIAAEGQVTGLYVDQSYATFNVSSITASATIYTSMEFEEITR